MARVTESLGVTTMALDPDEPYDVELGLRLILDGIQALIDRMSADGDTVPDETPARITEAR